MKLPDCFHRRSNIINIIGGLLSVAILIAVFDLAYRKAQYSKHFMVLEKINFSKADEYTGKLNIAFETETNTEALIVSGARTDFKDEIFDAEFFITGSADGRIYLIPFCNHLITNSSSETPRSF